MCSVYLNCLSVSAVRWIVLRDINYNINKNIYEVAGAGDEN